MSGAALSISDSADGTTIEVEIASDSAQGSWPYVPLDNVARRGSGHTPSKSFPEYWGGGIKWVSLQDSHKLDQRYISETAAEISKKGLANSSAVLHPGGVVILSRDAGVGKSAITTEPMAVSQHFMAWDCGPQLNNHFLYYWLQLQKSEFERIAIGNTIKTIGLQYFRDFQIPLPPRSIQDAIADALSDTDALIEGLESLLAKKRAIKRGAVQELLTGKRRLPGFDGEWMTMPLGELLSYEQPTKYLVRSSEYIEKSSTPVLTAGKTFVLGYTDEISGVYDKLPVIIFDDFTTDSKFVDFPFKAKSSAMKMLRVRNPKNDIRLIYELMQMIDLPLSDHKRYWISEYQKLVVALPEPEEQSAIGAVLSDMDAELAALEAKRDKARAVKQGMMQELLTGRVRLI